MKQQGKGGRRFGAAKGSSDSVASSSERNCGGSQNSPSSKFSDMAAEKTEEISKSEEKCDMMMMIQLIRYMKKQSVRVKGPIITHKRGKR